MTMNLEVFGTINLIWVIILVQFDPFQMSQMSPNDQIGLNYSFKHVGL